MIIPLDFKVRKWDYNPNASKHNLRTDSHLATHPLYHSEKIGVQGLCFRWTLVITGDNIEILYFSTEETYAIDRYRISDVELRAVVKASYQRSAAEAAIRNIQVGLDAGFPPFENYPFDLKQIREVLNM